MIRRIVLTSILLAGCLFPEAGHLSAQQIKGNYAIKNLETQMLLRPVNASKQENAAIVMYSPVNWKCLTWEFIHIQGNDYQLKNLFSLKTFHPENNKPEASSALKQISLQEGDAMQQWEFIPVGENAYRIKLRNTELYITPANNSGKVNTEVILQKRTEGNLQLWTIYEQHPSM